MAHVINSYLTKGESDRFTPLNARIEDSAINQLPLHFSITKIRMAQKLEFTGLTNQLDPGLLMESLQADVQLTV
jgi:hypothetical protein